MPVLINEFEIVPAAEPAPESGTAATGKPPAASSAPTTPDLDCALRRIHERAARLRAH
jgi:hypothetical protein